MLEAAATVKACNKIGHSSNEQIEYLHELQTWFFEHVKCGETFLLQIQQLVFQTQPVTHSGPTFQML